MRRVAAFLALSLALMPLAAQAQQADVVAEAKASIASGDYQRATALLARAAQGGSAEAQELLGVAFEKQGHLAQARQAYRAFLAAHPGGPDAARVRERLTGVEAAMESDEAAVRPKTKLAATPRITEPAPPPSPIQPDPPPTEDVWVWQRSGSVSQSYDRTDSFAGSGLLRGSLASHELAEDQIATAGDIRIEGRKGSSEITARISASDNRSIVTGGDTGTEVNQAYVDMRDTLSGLSARAGRQSRYDGGVFGRFDGVLAGIEATDRLLFQAVAGSPVYYGEDTPFADGRYFVGASADLTSQDKVWTASLYAIEQRASGEVDRRAIGSGLRYTTQRLQARTGLDYDVFYGEINNATASANWQASDALSFSASLDYRRVPFLLTSNALLGQPVDTLDELFDLFGSRDAETLAVDRTARAATASLGAAYRLSDDWTAALDATIADYSGTRASGGISGVPAPGTEYYLSARIDGANLFTSGDSVAFALSLADSDLYTSLIADAYARIPLGDDWRLSPRLRAIYRSDKGDDGSELLLMPSLGASYVIDDHWSLETEAAILWQQIDRPGNRDTATEFRAMVGYSYSF